MRMKITKKQVGFILLMLVVSVGMIAHLQQMSSKFKSDTLHQLYLERQEHELDALNKNLQLASLMYETAWNQVDGLSWIANRGDSISLNSMQAATRYVKNYATIDHCDVVMVDKFGTYYSSDGYIGVWDDEEKSQFMNSDRRAIVTTDEETGLEYMIFLERLPEDIKVQSVFVRYIAIALDTHGYEQITHNDGVSEGKYVYIIDADGNPVFCNGQMGKLYDPSDLMTSLTYVNFLNDASQSAFMADFAANRTSAYELMVGGQDYFISQGLIPNTEWTLVCLTPTDSISVDSRNMVNHTYKYIRVLGGVFVVMTVVLVICALIFSRIHRRVSNEKENAERILVMNEKLAMANKRANEATVVKSEFLSRMSHDMRTPINGIIGMTAMAQTHMDDAEKVAHCLDAIDKSSLQLMNLVEDVLSLNRLEDRDIVVATKEMKISKMCETCKEYITDVIGDKKIHFVQDVTCDQELTIYADLEVIRQIIAPIVDNAVKFSPRNGTITFRMEEVEREKEQITLRMSIEDNGRGMKKEFLPHLFEVFSQEQSIDRVNYEGTGLGLAISKGYVDMIHGTIMVESQEGKGSKFHIEFPLQMKPVKFSYDLNIKRNRTIKDMRILLVEDNLLNMEIAQEILEAEGAIIETAENGQEAINKFSNSEVDYYNAILMDIMMPVLDGYAATRAIRRMDREDAKHIPIIAMTANAYDEDVRKSVEMGMNSHVAKPIVVDILIKTLLAYKID